MTFQYPEYREFFIYFLAGGDRKLFRRYEHLFDPRDPDTKRKEFNAKRNIVFKKLRATDGLRCRLRIHPDCEKEKGCQVDHIIPLSTNELNKKLRRVKPAPGRKVPAESFGSNHPDNLILACGRCNQYKKHRLLLPEHMRLLLSRRVV